MKMISKRQYCGKKRPRGEDKGAQHKLYYFLKFSVNYLSYCTDIAKIFSLGLGTKPDETRPGFLFPKCAEIHHAFVVYKIFQGLYPQLPFKKKGKTRRGEKEVGKGNGMSDPRSGIFLGCYIYDN